MSRPTQPCRRPAHVVYREGERVLITDPREIKDPLSDALIALAARVEALEGTAPKLEGTTQKKQEIPFAAEDAERAAYRRKIDKLQVYVSGGEGI